MQGHPASRTPDSGQRWLTFIRNHAESIVACDFCPVVTANFRILYVLVVMEVGRRSILHTNVTAHPTADWTLQQLREALPENRLRYLIHDNDSIISKELDGKIGDLGISILRTPRRAHMSLGPGVPKSRRTLPPPDDNHHVIRDGHRVIETPVLGGLHHEYFLESVAA